GPLSEEPGSLHSDPCFCIETAQMSQIETEPRRNTVRFQGAFHWPAQELGTSCRVSDRPQISLSHHGIFNLISKSLYQTKNFLMYILVLIRVNIQILTMSNVVSPVYQTRVNESKFR